MAEKTLVAHSLPIDEFLPLIQKTLEQQKNLVLVASPGAGKTTRVPPLVSKLTQRKTLLLQPRRLAAKAAAKRIAQEQNWTLGKEIGYQVRNESKFNADTQILVITEALLLKKMLNDPELSDVGLIIFDEFHERSVQSDVALALCKELQLLREDLKIVVMSATIDAEPLKEFLNTPNLITVPGRTYPVETIYDKKSLRLLTDFDFFDRVTEKISQVLQTQDKGRHILCFLPGLNEIKQIQNRLSEKIKDPQILIVPLHGSLDLEQQELALAPHPGTKIILSTNIAETSLTINGVNTIIDSGLSRKLDRDTKRLFPLLKTSKISMASAEQRKGRAGREFPGRCFRLWTNLDEQAFEEYDLPAIHTEPLEEILLALAFLGISNAHSFSWFESPSHTQILKAQKQLKLWKLIDVDGLITELGKSLVHWPLELSWSKFLLQSNQQNIGNLAALTAALVAEKDFFAKQDFSAYSSLAQGSDLTARLHAYLDHPQRFSEVRANYHSYCQLLKVNLEWNAKLLLAPEALKLLHQELLLTFTHLLCRRRKPQEPAVVSVHRQGAETNSLSICKSEFLLALKGRALETSTNSIIDIAVPIEKEMLVKNLGSEIISKKTIEFSEKDGSFFQLEQKFLFEMEMDIGTKTKLSKEQAGLALTEFLKENFVDYQEQIENIPQLILRLNLVNCLLPKGEQLDWENTLRPQIIEMACMGSHSLEEILKKDWLQLADLVIPKNVQVLLQQEFPTHIQVPNGRWHPLIWNPEGVTLSVKIQECFGWESTPAIGKQGRKVKLILLGPNYRPLQTTSDLKSFWEKAYQEIRGPLRARYPKHAWPENPKLIP